MTLHIVPSFVLGSILGDAYLSPRGVVTFEHGAWVVKIIHPELGSRIDFGVLVYWFMDDGGLGDNPKFGLITSLHTSGSSAKLFFKRHTVCAFVRGIRPYMIPSMGYKLRPFTDAVLSEQTP